MNLEVSIAGRRFCFERPADLESLWSAMDSDDLGRDERIPYWVEIWPAAIMLAGWIFESAAAMRGQTCLDLGCGLGLCSCAAAACSARTLGVDYEPAAVRYAASNAQLNGLESLLFAAMDWRSPGFKRQAFSYILGADIVYEKRFFSPLLELFDCALAPGGRVWLTAPLRDVSKDLWGALQEEGWSPERLRRRQVSYREYRSMDVELWEVRRKADQPWP